VYQDVDDMLSLGYSLNRILCCLSLTCYKCVTLHRADLRGAAR
jgi:hypothetical protein